MTLIATIDQLRGRFHRCRRMSVLQDYTTLAAQIGMSKRTLHRFASGYTVREDSLTKIEDWCEKAEAGATTPR